MGCPVGGFVSMASIARVGHTDLHRKIGTWNADAVIAPRIHHHVGSRRHVTFDASRSGRPGLVEMMLRGIVLPRRVALEANAVAWGAKLQTMRIVTVAAGHSCVEHSALDKRAVLVNLILNLSVRI